ncbi:FMRFamide receptor-like [Pecten maximus]|uniref:FMRFamide receptor-like n=1 Tax=Pecten maximus TaxID=6579 RepID=UPI0014590BC6|nr:FMRFamide receptor-like [Pecten maximus]
MQPAKWGWWIKECATPIVVLVGIIGNCLSFAVMKSRNLRKKSYSHFLCALAVFDSLTLIGRQVTLVDELYNYLGIGHRSVFYHFNDAACKTYNFMEHMCYLMSSWLIVCMAAERVVAVCRPFKKSVLRTQTGAVAIIFSLFVILSYTQVFRFIMIGSYMNTCQAMQSFIQLYVNLHIYLYQFTLIFILPFLLVLIFNTMVLYQIYRVRREASSDSRSRVVARTHKTTFMLLAISIIYIITMLPLVIISICTHIALHSGKPILEVQMILISIQPWNDLLSVVSFVNYGINFFIYVVSGQSFRFELRRMIFSKERHISTSGTRTREEVMKLQ